MSVPPHVLAASLAAMGLHDPSVPVVPLVADSLIDDIRPAGAADRRLIFQGEGVIVDVSVTVRPSGRQLRVEVTPAEFTDVTLVQPGSAVRMQHGDADRALLDIAPGLTSLELRRPSDGATVRTAWLTL